MRLLLVCLAACGAEPVVLSLKHAQPLTAADVQSIEVFVLASGSCAALGAGPYAKNQDIEPLRREVLQSGALHLGDLPSTHTLTFLADAYGNPDALGPVIGSACEEGVRLSPGKNTAVVLKL